MKLRVDVISAKGLKAGDISGKSDPYCVVLLGAKEVFRTKIINETLNPEWKESVTLTLEDLKAPLVFRLFDKDKLGKDGVLGAATVALDGEDKDLTLKVDGGGELHVVLDFIAEDSWQDDDVSFSRPKVAAPPPPGGSAAAAAAAAAPAASDEFGGKEDATAEEFMAIKPWMAVLAYTVPSGWKKPADADAAPTTNLDVDFIHGYRVRDCRKNLFYCKSGELIYHTAEFGIRYNPKTNAQRWILEHTDDVVALAYNAKRDIVATGEMGKRPKIVIWSAETMAKKIVISGFLQRAVTSLAFNTNGTLLAAVGADDGHTLAVYDVEKGALVASSPGDLNKVLDVAFNPTNDKELVTCGVKHMKFWNLEGSALKVTKGLFGSLGIQNIPCVAIGPAGCLTGTGTGSILLWSERSIGKTMKGAKGAVTALAQAADGRIACGGKDGDLNLYAKDGKLLGSITCGSEIRSITFGGPSESKLLVGTRRGQIQEVDAKADSKPAVLLDGHFGEVWGLAVSPKSPTDFFSCAQDGTVRHWDAAAKKSVQVVTMAGYDFRGCDVSPNGELLACGANDGRAVVLNTKTLALVGALPSTRKSAIYAVKFSPDGRFLATGCHSGLGGTSGYIDIFAAAAPFAKKAEAVGHHSYITHLDFSEDGSVLQSDSGDYEHLFWKVDGGEQITMFSSLRDTKWKSWTCVLGWPVQGIWPPVADGTDVNACARNAKGDLIASVEDSGLLRLFRYPCIGSGFDRRGKVAKRPDSRSFRGHSSHVTNVSWLAGDKGLVTTGGLDCSVIQWKVVG